MRIALLDLPERRLRLEYQWVNSAPAGVPLVVFLHEGLGSLATWKDFPREFCARGGFRGLLYTRHGYGGSTPAAPGKWPKDYMHREAFEVLPALLRELGLEAERPWLFGHSDGATIALLYAAKYPAAAAGIVLVAPHTMVEDVTVEGVRAVGRAYAASGLGAKLARFHPDPDAVFWRWHDTWADPGFRDWNIEALLPAIRCPVLAIQGREDEFATIAQLASVQRQVPHAEVAEIPNCGHIPHREQPEALLEAALAFIRGHGAAESAP